jgi:uncharacterized membrane protein YeaQ/YmgE (transglycosylase-associated protein family)
MTRAIILGLSGACVGACLSNIFNLKKPCPSILGGVCAVGLFFLTGEG